MSDLILAVPHLSQRYRGDCYDPAFSNAPVEVARGDFDLAWLERDEFYAVITRKL